jgi:hypothetical protein
VKRIKAGGSGNQKQPTEEGGGIFAQLASVGKVFGQVAGIASLVVGALLAIPAALTAITYAAMPFVQALSPSTVEAFNLALDGLKATVGEGLIPIIAYATASVREWAGILLPTIRQLKPMVDRLASAVSGFMAGGVRAAVAMFGLLLQALDPLITSLSGWLNILGQVLEVAAVVITVLASFKDVVDALTMILEGPLFGVLDALGLKMGSLQDVVGKAIVGLVALAAMLLKLAGANDTLGKFRDGLAKSIASRKTPEGGLAAAPKDAAVSGIDSVVNKMQERSFVATSGAPTTRATDDLLTEMLKTVNDIAGDNSLKDTIKTAIRESLPGGETVASVAKVVSTVTDSSATSSDRFRAGREEGGFLGGSTAVVGGAASDLYSAVKFW